MNDLIHVFMTWENLAGFGGCTTVVILITQMLKDVVPIPAQLLSYLLAVLVLIPATAFTVGLSPESVYLIVFNSAIVSFASNGGYEVIKMIRDADRH